VRTGERGDRFGPLPNEGKNSAEQLGSALVIPPILRDHPQQQHGQSVIGLRFQNDFQVFLSLLNPSELPIAHGEVSPSLDVAGVLL